MLYIGFDIVKVGGPHYSQQKESMNKTLKALFNNVFTLKNLSYMFLHQCL